MRPSILMRMSTWNKMRENFSEEEKDKLNAAIDGETICPRGVTLDPERLGVELERKIVENKKLHEVGA